VEIVLVIGSLVLAGVFAVAGVAKLLDGDGSRHAARAFGVPDALAGVVGSGIPLVEVAIAALLLPAATRWWAAIGGLALLLAFCAAIGAAMARGEAPDCHCFGQLHSAPAGWRTLARNGVLALIAAFVVVAGRDDAGPGAFAWVSRLDGTGLVVLALGAVLAASVAVGGYVVAHVLRSYGRVLVRLDAVEGRLRAAGFVLDEPDEMPEFGLAPGTPAPGFSLPSVGGERVALGDLLQPGRPVLLLFTSPNCGSCAVLMPTVARWQREHADELTIALLSDGDGERIRAEAAEHGLERVLVDEGLTVYEAYLANGTPSAVLVGDDGSIASWLAAGSEWIESLVEQAHAGLGRTPGLPVGSEAPLTRLATLDGREVSVAEVVEGPTVALFWNPGCGFCRSMHDDVLAWEASRPAGAPALLVVSAGEAEEVRAERFASTVLLDPEWAVSTAFGADGTPMAVLVGADGRIASSVVGGGPAVLELLGTGALSAAS
jgi:methylamine dehydrogenase accessory protein MauD